MAIVALGGNGDAEQSGIDQAYAFQTILPRLADLRRTEASFSIG